MKRGLRDHWENQETRETGYGGSPGVVHIRFIGKSGGAEKEKKKKKDEMFLRSPIGTAVLMCIANVLRVFLLQGSRGIQGPQGAVGKKGENVSEHTVGGRERCQTKAA